MKKTNPVSKKQHAVKKESILKPLLLVVAAAFITFIQASGFKLTNFDDIVYITENPFIRDFNLHNLSRIFSEFYYGGYYPLTLLSFSFDFMIGGMNPKIYHLTNIFLHCLNSGLVFYVIYKLFERKDLALITALLFAVHPLHIESVAWVTERKDVLYSAFYLLALVFYLKFIQKKTARLYLITILFFLFSLLAKAQAIPFALVIILIDFHYDRKIFSAKVIFEKLPFLALALAFGVISILSQKSIGAISAETTLPILQRVSFAMYGFSVYLVKLIIPFHLSAFYPYPSFSAVYWTFIIPFVIYIAAVIYFFIKKQKEILFALLFFFLNIVFVLQIIQINDFVMADRFSYMASAGIFLGVAFLYKWVSEKFIKQAQIITIAAYVYFGFLVFSTFSHSVVWKDSISLWDDVLKKYPELPRALNQRGQAKADELADFQSAIDDYNQAISGKPDYYLAFVNRGYSWLMLNDPEKALVDYEKAISIMPENHLAYNNRANILAQKGNLEAAIKDYSMAIKLNPEYVMAYTNRGLAYINTGKKDLAMKDFNKAIQLDPANYLALKYRGTTYAKNGDLEKAVEDFSGIIEVDPQNAEAYYYRGTIELQLQRRGKACEDLMKAYDLGYPRAEAMLQKYCN